MRRMRTGLGVLTLLLGLAGCTDPNAHLRPPKQPEVLAMPPDDPRYVTPPTDKSQGAAAAARRQAADPAQPGGLPQRPNAMRTGPITGMP